MSIVVLGCSDHKSQIPTWGHLPAMDNLYWKQRGACAGKVFSSMPYHAIDVGKSLHQPGVPASGVGHQMVIGDTCLIASISTTVYESPEHQENNFYSVSIQVPRKDSRCSGEAQESFCDQNPISYYVLFRRALTQHEVGDFFKNKRMSDVIDYDARTQTVTFILDSKTVSYVLPDF